MAIYKPSELRQFLANLGIAPRKGLSQNFLIDGNIIKKIAAAAHAGPEDLVLEIGPGPGSLSEALLETGAKVIAVEKDPILAAALERLKKENNSLEIFCEDIMEFPVEKIFQDRLQSSRKAKVIANLPYHLTTPILSRLVPLNAYFSTLTLMVQDEVARRFTANPGCSDYSSFTVFLNFFTKPVYAFHVSRNCFYPPPKVDSAVITLELKKPPNVSDQEKFFKMTRTAFEQRRKMLRASLRNLYAAEKIMESLERLSLNPLARPEELSLTDFLKLFEKLNS